MDTDAAAAFLRAARRCGMLACRAAYVVLHPEFHNTD